MPVLKVLLNESEKQLPKTKFQRPIFK